jgi:hypothetical protein
MWKMFAKIFTQIFDSSIAEDWQTRLVFEDFLKLADINGVVDMTPEAIARRTNVPLEIIKRGIENLEKPDARSRNPEHRGVRILRLDDHRDWGWHIVNYAHYRGIASGDQQREKTFLRVKRHREKLKRSVTPCNAGNAMQRQMQTEREKQISNINLIKSNEGQLTNLKLDIAGIGRIVREIASNKKGWNWDNCKVEPAKIVAASLKPVLQPYVGLLDEPAVHAAWLEAVKRTHNATVDALANDSPAYCVGCFKEQLKDAVERAGKKK